jgi:predicted nucleic acid-binding protein
MIFCDTSAAVKVYLDEDGSDAMRTLFESETLYLSELARVEIMGVFHRLFREKTWAKTDFLAATNQLSSDDRNGSWSWLPLDQSILDGAARTFTTLPENIFLRSSDCISLVTAIHHNFTEIYTYDRHQSAAAPVLGLKAVKAP